MGKMKRKKKGGWRDEVRQIPLSLSLFKTVAKPVEGIEIEDVKSSQILQDRIFGRRRNVGNTLLEPDTWELEPQTGISRRARCTKDQDREPSAGVELVV